MVAQLPTKSLQIRSVEDANRLMDTVRLSAARVHDWIAVQSGDPLAMLRRMKFEPVGFHPLEDRELNIVEPINQTWTFAVAIAAARQLLLLHPEAGGFHLAPASVGWVQRSETHQPVQRRTRPRATGLTPRQQQPAY